MPTASTFWYWRQAHAAVATTYARARELQAQAIAHKAYLDAQAASVADVQVARLKWDAGRWMAGKINPREYGDKLLPGAEDGAVVTRVEYAWAPPKQLEPPTIDGETE